jgi:hypothetical protein
MKVGGRIGNYINEFDEEMEEEVKLEGGKVHSYHPSAERTSKLTLHVPYESVS